MAHIDFVIPTNKSELLSTTSNFYVKNVVGPKNLLSELKCARQALREEGPEYIIDAFDTYYSILHYGDSLSMDLIYSGFEDLHRAVEKLYKTLLFLFEDKESLNDELKMKFLSITKMLIYVYTQVILLIEEKQLVKNQGLLRNRKKSSKDTDNFSIDKKSVILVLNNILQLEIGIFWDPPVVEENFINIVSEVCYQFLQCPTIKGDKDVRVELFSMIGCLIKSYHHGTTFVIRMVQLIKINEHLVQCVPEGIQHLVQNFNCKGLIHDLTKEVTEWQTDEQCQDSQGARFCSQILSEMSVLMPDLMIPEVKYLYRYLSHDSATLRNSVLNVLTEVILKVLSHHELTDEQKESRDDLLDILIEHMDDVTATVRSKVIHHFGRLQKENAIPIKCQNDILEKVITHLADKGALVRKSAANCVGTFLSYNLFSSNLSLKSMEDELAKQQEVLRKVKTQFDGIKALKLEEIEGKWAAMVENLTAAVKEELEKDVDVNEEDEDIEIDPQEIQELIRMYLNDGKFKEAVQLGKKTFAKMEEFQDFLENNKDDDVLLYVLMFRSIFVNIYKLIEEMKGGLIQGNVRITEEDFKKMEQIESDVDYLQDYVKFLTLINSAIQPMTELLETATVGDMHEAVEFFITAYQFNIDNAHVGILAMLRVMQRNEQERKDHITDAFKTIYLGTNSKNLTEHTVIIVNRLIELLKNIPVSNVDDLQSIISEWTSKGVLDNSIIDTLWQYFTKKINVSDDDSRAATELLRMAAIGRKTIITRNVKLVATVAFSERGENCMQFLGSACELLSIVGMERIDITSKDPPFKIKVEDPLFRDLINILVTKFFEPVDYYNKALSGGVNFIYKLCNQADILCQELIATIMKKIQSEYQSENTEKEFPRFILVRLCQLLGFVAVKHLEYLDETVYKELKRRSNIREERKESKKPKLKPKKKKNGNAVAESVTNSTVNDESILEGAQAEDGDAEFILNVLENDTVASSVGLGKLSYLITNICERPDIYDDVMLQGAAVIALIRYMLVSSKFCQNHIQLLFTIFEKTIFPPIKCTILVHLSDLLTRFPNIIEPWTPRIYERLGDPSIEIRKATFFTLSNLILRDMIRAHSHLSQMVTCLIDDDVQLSEMSKTFFVQLSHKENNLYNVLPDIFSHLMETETVNDENLQFIMKFLFDLIDKTKHMENLVERFCCKFRLSEDIRQQRNIAYCLSLIQYNDKGLRKLQENFPTYKHLVQDPEIYASFKNIFAAANKVGKGDLKTIVAELEKTIAEVFEINEDGTQKSNPMPPPKSTRKGRRRKTRKISEEMDETMDE